MNSQKTQAEVLKAIRRVKNMPIDTLSGLTGIPINAIRDHEAGVRELSAHQLFAYAKALEVDPAEFEGCVKQGVEN